MSSGNKRSGGNPVTNVLKQSPVSQNPIVAGAIDAIDNQGEDDNDAPETEDPLAPPTLDSEAVMTAAAEERKKGRKGRASTILTGGQGLSDINLSLAKQTLMGK